jgi:hypothetical protein
VRRGDQALHGILAVSGKPAPGECHPHSQIREQTKGTDPALSERTGLYELNTLQEPNEDNQ